MNNEENNNKTNTESSKRPRIKKAKPITSKKPLLDKDHRILSDHKNGVEMNLICARYMVHRTYVEDLVKRYGK